MVSCCHSKLKVENYKMKFEVWEIKKKGTDFTDSTVLIDNPLNPV